MKCADSVLFSMLLLLLCAFEARSCGPGRGAGRRRGPRKLTPLVFKQHVPNVAENAITASGPGEGRIGRNDSRFQDLVPNYNQDIRFKDDEGTGADRLMTQRCKEKLNTLAISVMNQWPGVHLTVNEGWDEDGFHPPDSLHYEGRAVDLATSDRDRSKYGMLARLAVEAGFDWVFYESRTHIHCSVKSESSQAAKYGGCFSSDSTVITSTGETKKISDVQIGEKLMSQDPSTLELTFSEVMLFLDYNPEETRDFLEIHVTSGQILKLTPTHLLFTGNLQDSRTIFAEHLQIGDSLFVKDDKNKLKLVHIVKIKPIVLKGVYAPLTLAGTVVVNDVLASCYAVVDSQFIAHAAFIPLRMYLNFKEGFYRLWVLLAKPLDGWSVPNFSYQKPSKGIHWYARSLYSMASYLLPWILH